MAFPNGLKVVLTRRRSSVPKPLSLEEEEEAFLSNIQLSMAVCQEIAENPLDGPKTRIIPTTNPNSLTAAEVISTVEKHIEASLQRLARYAAEKRAAEDLLAHNSKLAAESLALKEATLTKIDDISSTDDENNNNDVSLQTITDSISLELNNTVQDDSSNDNISSDLSEDSLIAAITDEDTTLITADTDEALNLVAIDTMATVQTTLQPIITTREHTLPITSTFSVESYLQSSLDTDDTSSMEKNDTVELTDNLTVVLSDAATFNDEYDDVSNDADDVLIDSVGRKVDDGTWSPGSGVDAVLKLENEFNSRYVNQQYVSIKKGINFFKFTSSSRAAGGTCDDGEDDVVERKVFCGLFGFGGFKSNTKTQKSCNVVGTGSGGEAGVVAGEVSMEGNKKKRNKWYKNLMKKKWFVKEVQPVSIMVE